MSAIRRHEAGAQGVAHEPGHVADAEAVHDLRTMSLHGLYRQVEQKGDFLCALAAGDEPQHLALPRSEYFGRRIGSKSEATDLAADIRKAINPDVYRSHPGRHPPTLGKRVSVVKLEEQARSTTWPLSRAATKRALLLLRIVSCAGTQRA